MNLITDFTVVLLIGMLITALTLLVVVWIGIAWLIKDLLK